VTSFDFFIKVKSRVERYIVFGLESRSGNPSGFGQERSRIDPSRFRMSDNFISSSRTYRRFTNLYGKPGTKF